VPTYDSLDKVIIYSQFSVFLFPVCIYNISQYQNVSQNKMYIYNDNVVYDDIIVCNVYNSKEMTCRGANGLIARALLALQLWKIV